MEIANVAEGEKGGAKTNPDAQISQRRNKRGQIHRTQPLEKDGRTRSLKRLLHDKLKLANSCWQTQVGECETL